MTTKHQANALPARSGKLASQGRRNTSNEARRLIEWAQCWNHSANG
jgi:hypothetical protein